MQPASDASAQGVVVRHRVAGFSDRWLIPEAPVPEAAWHYLAGEYFRALLAFWLKRSQKDGFVYRNLAVRVREDQPSVGFDPDVCLVAPAPPDAASIDSLKLWLPLHQGECLCVEIVSKNHPTKDYVEVPDKCAAAGVAELIVFDPLGHGPKARGGPQLLQVWQRAGDGAFERVYAGDGPAHCRSLDAWLFASAPDQLLCLSDDRQGQRVWLTAEEFERAAKETERAAKEAALVAKNAERAAKETERAAKESALRRVAELEAELQRHIDLDSKGDK